MNHIAGPEPHIYVQEGIKIDFESTIFTVDYWNGGQLYVMP